MFLSINTGLSGKSLIPKCLTLMLVRLIFARGILLLAKFLKCLAIIFLMAYL